MRLAILAFVFGAWLMQRQPALPELAWALLLPPLALLAWVLRRRVMVSRLLVGAAAVLAGFCWAAMLAQQRLGDALPAALEGQDIQLTGVVASLPRVSARGERFEFDVERVETESAQVPRRISLSRYFAGYGKPVPADAAPLFRPGERWRLTVRLKRPHGSYNPGGFDYEAWALERNIRATGYVRERGVMERLEPPSYRPGHLLERLRLRVRERFQEVLGEARYGAMLQALAIGDQQSVSEEDWEIVRRTGVIHLMSISGLHVTMLAGLVFALVHALWRRVERLTLHVPARKAATLAGLLAAAAYAAVAGFAIPTQRTLYMLAVVAAALWAGRSIAFSLVLCWALLAVVLLDPWAVLAPGFWLSFAAVAVLAYVGSGRLARPGVLTQAAHAQWAVTLGLAPLLLALFQQVSLVSPLANALAIPLVGLLVTPLTLLGMLLPVDALLQLAHVLMAWCMTLLELAADLPLAVWQQHAPAPWTVAVAMAGVLWLLLPRGFPLRWLGMIALAPMFLWPQSMPQHGELRVAVLDAGQGLAVVLQTARHALLYDTGPRYSGETNAGDRVILPYLRISGIQRLDGMVLSHDDSDHTGGAAAVLQALPVDWMASSLPPGHVLHSLPARSWPCAAGQSWEWDGVRFDMLHPHAEDYLRAGLKDNNLSCALRVSGPHGSLLLTGDIERAAERALLARATAGLAADVLVAPHHGSSSSSTPAFVAAVAPRATIFTAGYRNRFRHPHPQVVARYREAGSAVYRSDADGAVLIDFAAGRGMAMRTWRQAAPRYWHDEAARVAENGRAG